MGTKEEVPGATIAICRVLFVRLQETAVVARSISEGLKLPLPMYIGECGCPKVRYPFRYIYLPTNLLTKVIPVFLTSLSSR